MAAAKWRIIATDQALGHKSLLDTRDLYALAAFCEGIVQIFGIESCIYN